MKKIGVLGLMAALAVTGAVAFLPKGVMAAEDSDQTISQGVYIGDVDVSGMTQEEAKKAVEDDMSEAKAALRRMQLFLLHTEGSELRRLYPPRRLRLHLRLLLHLHRGL